MTCAPKLLALAAGLVLAGSCSSPTPPGPAPGPDFDQAKAWQHLERIVAIGPRPSGSQGAADLRDYLELQLEALGLTVVREPFTDGTPAGDIHFENLWVDLPPTLGDGADAPWIVIGTHYDTKILGPEHGETPDRPFLGANDGGSGTAIQLELARVLSQDERPREVGLRLLFLDGEEAVNFDWEGKDNTYGSRYHAERLLREGEASRFGACVILDMLGDRDLQLVHDVNSRLALLEIFQDAARREGLGKHLMTQRQAVRDDHQSFLRVGIPAVDLIDLTYGPNNGWWHTVEDTLDKCSADSLGVAARIFLAGLPDLEAWVLDQR